MKVLRRKQVAAMLGVNVRTVDNWAKAGKMPTPYLLAGIPVWDEAELVRWLQMKKVLQ